MVVAEVGSARIIQRELRDFVENLPPDLRSKKEEQEAREDYLQTLIDRELMLLEAQVYGLDTTVMKTLKDKLRTRVLAIYRAREIFPQIHVSEEEIKKRLIQKRLDRERTTWGIATRTREEIEEVIEELESGTPFEEVALQFSIDIDSAKRGGVLGSITLPTARQIGIPDTLFLSLPTGKVSKVLSSPRGFFVVRFTDDRQLDLDAYEEMLALSYPANSWIRSNYEQIKKTLEREKILQREEEIAEIFARKFDWRLHQEGLTLLLDKGRSATPFSIELSPEEAQTPLYLFDGGQVTLADYLDALRRVGTRRGLEDSATVVAAVEQLVLRPVLFEEAARRTGIPEAEIIVRWKEEKKEELMLNALRKAEVVDSVTVSEEEIRHYYEEHADLFRQEDSFWICEVLVGTEEEANQVRKKVEAGGDISAIARERSLRPEARQKGGVIHLHSTGKYPGLLSAVKTAERGQLIGPLQVDGGYSVFRFLRQDKGDLRPYAEVRGQARAFVRRAKEQERFDVFMERVRQKYRNHVQVFEDRLAEALPDEFLTGR